MATDWVAGSRGRLSSLKTKARGSHGKLSSLKTEVRGNSRKLSSLKTEVRNLYLGAETQVSAVATAEDLGTSLLPVTSSFR